MEEMEMENLTPAEPEKKPANVKRIVLIAVAAVVILAAAAVACVYLFREAPVDAAALNREMNFNNGGKFAYDDNALYYIGLFNETDENVSLYSTDYEGGNRTQISADPQITRIRIVDDRIFYQKRLEDGYSLGSMKLDGSDAVDYITTQSSIIKYDAHKDTLIYMVDKELHTLALEDLTDQVLYSGVETFALDEGVLYYCKDGAIHRRDMADGSEKKLCDAAATTMAVGGDQLYMTCSGALYTASADKESTPKALIADNAVGGFVVLDEKIYYSRLLSEENSESMIAYMTADVSEELLEDTSWTYRLALTGSGEVFCAPVEGGSFDRANTDPQIVFSLYCGPDGLICKSTILSSTFEEVGFRADTEE